MEDGLKSDPGDGVAPVVAGPDVSRVDDDVLRQGVEREEDVLPPGHVEVVRGQDEPTPLALWRYHHHDWTTYVSSIGAVGRALWLSKQGFRVQIPAASVG